MQITRVNVRPVSIPYRSPYDISQGTVPTGKYVIIKVPTDNGLVGYGGAATIIPRAGGTQESIVFVLRDYFAPAIIADDRLDYEGVLRKVERVAFGLHLYPFAKAAVDHALFDILGEGPQPPRLHAARRGVPQGDRREPHLRVGSPNEKAETALRLRDEGHKMLTLKGTSDTAHDLQALARIRAAVGAGYSLDIGPNQAYPATEAIRVLRRMEAYGLYPPLRRGHPRRPGADRLRVGARAARRRHRHRADALQEPHKGSMVIHARRACLR